MSIISNSNMAGTSNSDEDVWTISLDINNLWKGALIALATLFSHWQAIGGGFIWDDDAHVTRADLRSLQGLWDIWFKLGATQQYYPLVHSTFWFEQAFWGDNAALYHITNIVFHILVVFVLVAVLKRLEIPGAWVAGFIFALHPVHVESVAWVTEQKNTISAFFYLLAAFYYLKFDDKRDRQYYGYALLFFIIALLSKTVTATLPAALLVIFWWKRGKLSFKKDVVPLIPWFALGIAGGIFTAWVEKVYIGAQGADYQSAVQLTPVTRCLLAGHVILFYLSKLLWPTNLIFIYEHWSISAGNYLDYLYTLGVIIGLVLLVRYALTGGRRNSYDTFSRAPLAGFLFFAGTLFPVLGFANVYPFMFSYVADHFQYLASLGIIVPIAAFLTISLDKLSAENKGIGAAIGGVCLALLGFLSWNQCSMYSDGETLYRVTIERNPSCWMAHNNLGAIMLGHGRIPEATEQFAEALKIRPNYPDARSNMCSVLLRNGRVQEALVQGLEAVRLRPNSPENLNNLGIALANLGRTTEAINMYQAAVRLRPNYVEVLNNLGNALMQLNRNDEALKCYQTAINYQPNFSDGYANIGLLLLNHGNVNQGVTMYEQAIKLQPNVARYHQMLGVGYSSQGKLPDAINQFQEALKLEPNNSELWFYLGNAFVAAGKLAEAEVPYLNSVKINPNNVAAENNLAAVYFRTSRNPEAISHYQMALRINPNYAEAHNNLGVVYIAAKFLNEGIAEYKKATQINPKYSDSYNNWGLALLDSGNPKEAVLYLKKGIEINSNNPDYHDNLARAYIALGQKDVAKSENSTANILRNPKQIAPSLKK